MFLMQIYGVVNACATDFFYLCIDKIYYEMNIQQMEYIVALDKYRHFVLAAEACGVTQPTLSAMIQKLEDELDVKIFVRDRKQVAPTGIGEKIIRQARVVLNEMQRIRELVADESDTMNGHLSVGILPTIAPYLVPDFIRCFRRDFPNVDLLIDEKENQSLLHDLRFGSLDMIITTPPENLDGFLEIPVYIEKFVAYFSEHCLQARSLVASGMLPAEHMWILKEGHCVQNGNMNLCQNKELGNHIYEAGSIETLVRIVDKNGGYTIIPELHIGVLDESQREKVQVLNMEPPAQRCVSILIKDDFIRERMLNGVLDTLKQIIPEYMMEPRLGKRQVRLRAKH